MSTSPATGRPRPLLWGGLVAAAVALITAGQVFGVLSPPAAWIMIGLVVGATMLVMRAHLRMYEAQGELSPALRRYNQRFMLAGALYTVAMIAGGNLHGRLEPASPAMWAVAIAAVLPVLAMIWTVFRYYAEEQDEYLRHRAVIAALTGLALVLVLGTVWGFFEMFGLVGHVWNWWVFPVWAIGLGWGMRRSCARRTAE